MANKEVVAEKKKAMLAALEKTLGIVSTACKACGVTANSHAHYMKTDPEYKAAADGMIDIALDFVESKLFQAINEGQVTAIIYYLNNHGKRRGYAHPKAEANNEPQKININIVRE